MSHLNINGVDKPLDHIRLNNVRSENLFDKDNFIDGGNFYPVASSSSLVASANTDILLIPCKTSTYYTVSRSSITKRFMICFTTTASLAAGTPVYNLTGSPGYDPEQMYTLTAQSGADSKYLLIYYAKHAGNDSSTAEEIAASLATMMVNWGSTALPYQPYYITKEAWEARDKTDHLLWGRADTFTGTNSISARCYGLPVKSWEIDGNSQQSGTPTSDNPVYPEFVGEKTKNLLPLPASDTIYGVLFTVDSSAGTVTASGENQYTGSIVFNLRVPADVYGDFYLSGCPSGGGNSTYNIIAYDRTDSLRCKKWDGTTASENDNGHGNVEIKIVQGHTIDIQVRIAANYDPDNIVFYPMLRTPTASADFEPYGYKLSITSAGQTVPMYLGQVQTTRKIKKLVLTGMETYSTSTASNVYLVDVRTNPAINANQKLSVMCTHYEGVPNKRAADLRSGEACLPTTLSGNYIAFKTTFSSKDDFITYIAQQYTTGTPVCVWYVLATPTTGIVNEPLSKIGAYVDTLTSDQAGITIPTTDGSTTISVDTTLAPSRFEIKVHAKPI